MPFRTLSSLAILVVAFAGVNAFANSIANHPGWKLEKMEKEGEQENGVIEYSDYFALYPNDTRPPITIDGNTATRIFTGQISPESVYFARTNGAAAAAAAKPQSESSGNGSVGWQVAESTYVPLGEIGTVNTAARAMNAATSSSLLGQGGSGGELSAAAAGGAHSANGSYQAGTTPSQAAAMNAASGVTINNAGNRGTFNSVMPTPASVATSNGVAQAAAEGRAPASTGSTAAYTGDASAVIGSGNQTYSQMIDAAMSNASRSLCGRMGAYAAPGQCR